MKYAGAWLDFTQTYLGQKTDKYPPKSDLEQIFKKQLLFDQAILAVTLFWSRGFEDRLDKALEQIPKLAIKYGYELESMCGLENTYKCSDPKLSSTYRYNKKMSVMIYKVHKLEDEEEDGS